MQSSFSQFASSVESESAFDVLAVAKALIAKGKDVIELEIGDSPFPSSSSAAAALKQAIDDGHCRYGPSAGIAAFRQVAADYVNDEYGFEIGPDNVIAGPGAKNFEQLFLETFVNPGDGVLVFSPHFPTYPPNIARRGGRLVISQLRHAMDFRPNLDDVRSFLQSDPSPKAIIINSPHNPTGGIATKEDVEELADLIRGKDVAVFSDEPYDRMVWQGRHHSIAAQPGMLEQCVAAYTFSKSFSMSGWRLGFAVSSNATIDMLSKLTNTAISCVSPFTQLAGIKVLRNDRQERDERMSAFRSRLQQLVSDLNGIEGVDCLMPGGTFYAFPCIAEVCNRHSITSHGLAMYLLEYADSQVGVACLGGECFGDAGQGFMRLSVAQPPERLKQAVDFMRSAKASKGGRSIVAMGATARGGQVSRIVPRVDVVTALRTDVDIVVTEFGVADLRYASLPERRERLIDIAHPDFRDQLRAGETPGT